jgi:O-antigen/teichoic acid export membrane protein
MALAMNQAWTRYLPVGMRSKLEGRPSLQNVISNTGWLFADNIVRMGVGLLIGVWVARYLGPEQFGSFSYALAFVALFSPLAALGLDDIVVRDLVRDPASKDQILGSAFLLKLVGGAISLLAAVAVIYLLRPEDRLAHWLVAVIAAGGIFQSFYAIEFWFNSQVQAKYTIFSKNAAFLICALGKIALILTGGSILALAWIGVLETMLAAAGLVLAYHARGHRIGNWVARVKTASALMKDSWPLLFSCVVIVIYLRIDQVMLGQMAGSQTVGVYSVAVRLAEVWFFFSSAVYWSVLPSLIGAKAAGDALFYQRLQKYFNLMAFAAYLVAIPVLLSANWLVLNLFGEAYAGAGPILAVLVCANMFIYLDSARSAFFNVMNWYKIYLVTLALGALLNVLLNLYMIPRYGGMGAAIASCISYWFAVHGACFLYRPLHRVGFMLTKAMLYPKIW